MLRKAIIAIIAMLGAVGIGSGNVFAVSGDTATIAGGKTWNICVSTGTDYAGSAFSAEISKTGFVSQIVFDDFQNTGCKSVKLSAGDYSVHLLSPMNTGEVSYTVGTDTLTFAIASVTNKYLNMSGSLKYHVDGQGGTTLPTVFELSGSCTFRGVGNNIIGDTCVDSTGKDWTNYQYIDTGVQLFSQENAGKDFEVYFELESYESSQEAQATFFNAKLEDSSKYYPGFVVRFTSGNVNKAEITSRRGVNSSTDKKTYNYNNAPGTTVKVIRKDGMITYSINGGNFLTLDDFSNFSAYFTNTAWFGGVEKTDGSVMRIIKGTMKNMYIKLGEFPKYAIDFDPNGGDPLSETSREVKEGKALGTLPAATRTGHRLTGWNTAADGSGVTYDANSIINGGVTLYAQWEEEEIQTVALLDTGKNVNVKLKKLAGNASATDTDNDTNIKDIQEASALPAGFDTEDTDYIISTTSSPVKVHAWFDDTDNDNDGVGDGIIYYYSDAETIYANADSSNLFSCMRALTSLTLPSTFDTSKVTNMSAMFSGMQALTSLTLPSTFDTSKVTDMSSMFSGMWALTSLTLPDAFNTSNVTNMSSMFWYASALTSLTLPDSFNTSKVTDMNYMFGTMRALTSLTLPVAFDTSNVTSMYNMFQGMTALTSLTLPATFDTSSVTDMENMFSGMTALTSLTLPDSFDTSNVTNMSAMFSGMQALTSLTLPSTFDTSKVTDMDGMFGNMRALVSLTLPDAFDTSNVKYMQSMFSDMRSLASLTLPDAFDTSKVTNMRLMFYGMQSLTSLTLPSNFVINSGTTTTDIFKKVSSSATLYAADNTARSLWPGVLGN